MLHRFVFFALLATTASSTLSFAQAAAGDAYADRVLGQTVFSTNVHGSGLNNLYWPQGVTVDRSSGRIYAADRRNYRVLSWPDAASFTNGQAADISITSDGLSPLQINPTSLAVDPSHNLYIADFSNNRVLMYTAPVTNTSTASLVIGQPDLTSNLANYPIPPGTPTNQNLSGPFGIAVDSSGNLYVADLNNNRVLRFSAPISASYVAADLVIGHPDFTSNTANNGSVSATATGLNSPQGIALESSGNLYVADTLNHRVLKYNTGFSNGMAASVVIGQPNFTSNLANQGGGSTPSARTLNYPVGLAIDTTGHLFVADVNNNRALGYKPPFSNGLAARLVFGQPDFIHSAYNPNGPPSADSLWQPYGVAADNAQNVYIADYYNNRVLGFDGPFVWTDFSTYFPFIRKK